MMALYAGFAAAFAYALSRLSRGRQATTATDPQAPNPLSGKPIPSPAKVSLKYWGVPDCPLAGPGACWPARGPRVTRVVPYQLADGRVLSNAGGAGNGGTMFGAARKDGLGARKHAAIDLVAWPPQSIVAVKAGKVVRVIPRQYVGLDAVIVDHGDFVANYAEIAALVQPGKTVAAGDVLGRAVLNSSGNSMLHFETWSPGHAPSGFQRWVTALPGLLNPTPMLLDLAARGL